MSHDVIVKYRSEAQGVDEKTCYFTNEYRVRYYLGKLYDMTECLVPYPGNKEIVAYDDTEVIAQHGHKSDFSTYVYQNLGSRNFYHTTLFSEKIARIPYFDDLNKYLIDYTRSTGKPIQPYIYHFTEQTHLKPYPCFIKAKRVGKDDMCVLLKLNTNAHTRILPTIAGLDIPFEQKMNRVVWRGTNSGIICGFMDREDLVRKYQNHPNPNIDIKYTRIIQPPPEPRFNYVVPPHMSIKDMLRYKFIIVVEGNDVATGLKWALLSNSVVLMKKPIKCSWFMEDELIPYVHYVPLSDKLDNVEEQFTWCLQNMDQCKQIAQNATKYMRQFMDERNEALVTTQVIDEYFKRVKFVPGV